MLPEELRRRGATVDIVTVYRTIKAFSGNIGEILETEHVDCVVFTSPSTIPPPCLRKCAPGIKWSTAH